MFDIYIVCQQVDVWYLHRVCQQVDVWYLHRVCQQLDVSVQWTEILWGSSFNILSQTGFWFDNKSGINYIMHLLERQIVIGRVEILTL